MNTSSLSEDICSETYQKGALIDNTNKQNQKLANSVSRVSFGAEFVTIGPVGETGLESNSKEVEIEILMNTTQPKP